MEPNDQPRAPAPVCQPDDYLSPVRQLLSLGEARRDEARDYAALGVSPKDVPGLIRMATDQVLHNGPQDNPVVWAPVHAWRALAQLRAPEAIAPLVELFSRADDGDDWVSDDLPKMLAQFGGAALNPIADFLSNAAHGDWARAAAAKTIGLMAETHPELRAEGIARLSVQLDRFAGQSEILNALLIAPLWDLKAVEALPAIERAFASEQVDESVQGDLEDVQIHFGLKTQREHPPKPNEWTRLGEDFRARWRAAGLPLPDAEGDFPELPPRQNDFLDSDVESPAISLPYVAPPKVGRNEPCPCGSGKKYKKCCGT